MATACCSVAALAILATVAGAQRPEIRAPQVRINGPLARELRSGDVVGQRFTADGTRLVYQADRAQSGLFELYGVPADGSAPSVRLNPPLSPGDQLLGWSTGAGNRVVLVVDRAIPGVYELLSVPADASASPVLLSPSPAFSFWLNPAGDQVYFRDSVEITTLQRVPIDGSAAPSVVASCPEVPLVVGFSPDGATALLRMFGDPNTFRIYAAPADGSGPLVQLHQTAGGMYLSDVRCAADGIHLVFEEVQVEGIFFPNFLFSVPLDASSPALQLNTTNGYQGNGYELDPSSSQDRLVYQEGGIVHSIAYDGAQRAALTPSGWQSETGWFGAAPVVAVRGPDVVFVASTTDGAALLRAPLDGSQVGVPLFPPSSISIGTPEILASGAVLYVAGFTGTGLHTVPLAGGTPLLLNPPLVPNRGTRSFLVHPDGQHVAFLATTTGKDEVYLVPLDGSQAPRKLNAPLPSSLGNVSSYSFTPDGLSLLYTADPLVDHRDGAFRAPLDGLGPVIQLNEPVLVDAIGGDVLEFRGTGDGRNVVYRADEDEDEAFDLFVAGTSGRRPARSLTAALAEHANVRPGFALAPGDERVVFQSLEQASFALRSAATVPGQAPLELDSSAVEFPLPLLVTPDGTRAVYRRVTSGSADLALRSVPIDGSSPPITLHPPLGAGRSVLEFQLSPDSRFAVYRANPAASNVFELFSAPLDGSAPPARLHPPLAAGGSVFPFRIAPDSARVVFRSERVLGQGADLYSAPIDGSFAPARLNAALPAGRSVVEFEIAPDASAVVYRANALAPDRFDLFRASIHGRAPPLRRTGGEPEKHAVIRLPQATGGRSVQSDFRFTADGTVVLFRANTQLASRFELYRVSSDGSSNPVKLSGPLIGVGAVASFALSPDQSRVAYLADALSDETFELFSVPLAGGPVVRLDPMPAFADVSSFRIDPQSRRVVYLADRNADAVLELFAAPLDGSAPAERVSGQLQVSGDVESDFAPLFGGRTLYRADQDVNDVLELFVSLERPVLPK